MGPGESASQIVPSTDIFGGELVPHLIVWQALLRGHQTLVSAYAAVHAREKGEAFLHLDRERLPQFVDVRDDLLHGLFIEVERARHVVEDADVIHDQTVGLFLAESPVGPADCLQEVVVLHRLVEIHHLEDGRVEAGQEFAGDDDELERVRRVAETVEQLFLGVLVADVLLSIRAGRPGPRS